MKIFAAVSTFSLLLLLGSDVAKATSAPISNGQIISLVGEVKIKRSSGYIITPNIGTYLYPGDELLAANNGDVLLQCRSDSSTVSLQRDKLINPCIEVKTVKCTSGLAKCPERGDVLAWNHGIPYINTPRSGKIFSDRPLISWQAVPQASYYTLEVRSEKGTWKTKVSETQIVYGDEQPLQPGIQYTLIVETDAEISSMAEEGLPTIEVIDSVTAQKVQAAREKIQQEPWSEVTKSLAIKNLYLEHELISEAILVLEDLVTKQLATRGIYRQLGDLYFQQLLLVPKAKDYYLQALNMSGNLEETAELQEVLSDISRSLKKEEEAMKWLRLAKSSYEELGNLERVREIEQLLKAPR